MPHDESVPPIDYDSPVPLNIQVAEFVEQRVISGAWRAPHKFAAERDLAGQWGVSYWTVHRAMRRLREKGIVLSVQGRGTFVNPDWQAKPQ